MAACITTDWQHVNHITTPALPLTNPLKYVTIWLHMNTSVTSYQAISDGTRRQILDLLRRESLTAGDIAQSFPEISRPAVSKHLAILRRTDLVKVKKSGREQIYSLNAIPLREVNDWLSGFESYWDQQLDSFKNYVESKQKGVQNES